MTDNAANCKAAGKLIEERFPHITWSPCVAHVCDLALEDIFSIAYFKDVHAQTKGYVGFITNHQATLAAWREFSDPGGPADVNNLQFIKPGDTRFGSAFLMLERVLKLKARLQQFVVSAAWASVVGNMKSADQAGAEEHKEVVLLSAYWKKVQQACTVAEPIIKLLRNSDSDTPTVGKVGRSISGRGGAATGQQKLLKSLSRSAGAKRTQHKLAAIAGGVGLHEWQWCF